MTDTAPKHEDWTAQTKAVVDEANGLMTITAIRLLALPDIALGIAQGDPRARKAMVHVQQAIDEMMQRATLGMPMECLFCPAEFVPTLTDPPALVCVVEPAVPNPKTGFLHLVCRSCDQARREHIAQDLQDAVGDVTGMELRTVHIHREHSA